MLNVFYWYSLIWSTVIVLYELKLSSYNREISNELMFFLLLSIVVSLILGFCFRKQMVYPKNIILKKYDIKGTILICIFGVVTFLYAGHIPLISIISGSRSYGDFDVLPIIQPILINYIIYRVCKLTFYYLETEDKHRLFEIIIILSVVMLMFFKGTMIFCLFGMINLFISKKRINSKISLSYALKIVSLLLVIFYINGGLANLRTGYDWDDNSFILRLGAINNELVPIFLPKQLLWGYVYITSPLANLNLCVQNYTNTLDITNIVISTLPLFLAKRIFSDNMSIFDNNNFSLYHEALNACTGYVNSVVSSGIIGMYYYFFILVIQLIILLLILKQLGFNEPYYFSVMAIVITFLFFYNTLVTAATSLLLFIVLGSAIKRRVRIKYR